MDPRDDFNDLKLIDQFVPLEQLEESLYPFNYLTTLNSQSCYTNLNVNYDSFNLNEPCIDINNHSEYTDSNESNLSNSTIEQQVKLAKFPEPYAIMIVKAILSRDDNVMQLKDIYNYFITNYETFAAEADSTKWKNSIRHNLSRHKYFIKTSVKNAQGHYWSIDADYLKYFKQGIYDCKTLVKQVKLKRQADLGQLKLKKKVRRTKKQAEKENISNQSSLSFNNDSAYMSNNDYDNSFCTETFQIFGPLQQQQRYNALSPLVSYNFI